MLELVKFEFFHKEIVNSWSQYNDEFKELDWTKQENIDEMIKYLRSLCEGF